MTPRKLLAKLWFIVSLILVFCSVALADQVTEYAQKDTYVWYPHPDDCYGDLDFVAVGAHMDIYGYVCFDLSDIPDGVNVTQATLTLWRTQEADDGNVMIARAASIWYESGSNCLKWPGVGPAYPPTPIMVNKQGTGTLTINVTSIVEQWIEFGQPNYGFGFETTAGRLWFASSEYATSSKMPKLTVTFIPNTCSASGSVTDILGTGIHNVRMDFSRVSGSGALPDDDYSNVLGNWEQGGFEEGTTYRVTPIKSDCGSWVFSPPYRDFSCSSTNLDDLDFTGAPPIPDGPVVTAVPGPEFNEITLSWSHVCGALSYVIRYDDDDSPPWDPNPNGTPGSGEDIGYVDHITISGLATGQEYVLQVAAYNAAGLGNYSNPIYETPREPVFLEFEPPFSGATKSAFSEEIAEIFWTCVGHVPSTETAESGRINQITTVVLPVFGGTVYQAYDSILWNFQVPYSGQYRVTVNGHSDGRIYAYGEGIIDDMKHGVWVGAGIRGRGHTARAMYNTMPEGLTTGFVELGTAALHAILSTIGCGGVCWAFDVVLGMEEILSLYNDLQALGDALIGFNDNVVLQFDADLDKDDNYQFGFFLWSHTKAGVSSAFAMSLIESEFEITSITFEMLSGTIGPKIEVAPSELVVLPAIHEGEPVSFANVFTVSNVGDETVNGTVSVPAGPFTVSSGGSYSLLPGESQNISFDVSSTNSGYYSRVVTFTGGAGAERTITCTVLDADPVLSVLPSSECDYGSVRVGETASTHAFTVVNAGRGLLSGTVSVEAPFEISGGTTFELSEGESHVVTVSFSPQVDGHVERNMIFSDGSNTIIRTVSGSGCSEPGAVQPTIAALVNTIYVDWQAAPDATSYELRIMPPMSNDDTTIVVNEPGAFYELPSDSFGLAQSGLYRVELACINDCGRSEPLSDTVELYHIGGQVVDREQNDTLRDVRVYIGSSGGNPLKSQYVDSTLTNQNGYYRFVIEPGAYRVWRDSIEGDICNVTVTNASVDGKNFVGVTDVREIESPDLPNSYSLAQNYPNPFNPTTQIEFEIPRAAFVEIHIYNVLGERLKTLISERLSAGRKVVTWDGSNDRGMPVSSGVYFYRITADGYAEAKKMLMLK